MTEIFFQLLQAADGRRSRLEYAPSTRQWSELFRMAKEQAVTGVCADGIERLSEGQRPPRDLLTQWGFTAARIEQRNRYLNGLAARVCRRLEKDGFKTCLLKGQGAALYYPDPLRRQSGDLDIWLMPVGNTGKYDFRKCRRAVVEYAHRHCRNAEICLHNIVFPVLKDVPIELHFIPFYFNSPFTERRFRKYLSGNVDGQFRNGTGLGVACPTDAFNIIFLLAHAFRHFLLGGIGLRQIMDYYYLTVKWSGEGRLGEKPVMEALRHDLNSLGLMEFCGAMMWVAKRVFGLEEERMLTAPDERLGRLLLDKVMRGGNFGQYMKDNPFECRPGDGHIIRLYKRTRSGMQMLRYYPSECIWHPLRIIEMFFILRYDRLKYKGLCLD